MNATDSGLGGVVVGVGDVVAAGVAVAVGRGDGVAVGEGVLGGGCVGGHGVTVGSNTVGVNACATGGMRESAVGAGRSGPPHAASAKTRIASLRLFNRIGRDRIVLLVLALVFRCAGRDPGCDQVNLALRQFRRTFGHLTFLNQLHQQAVGRIARHDRCPAFAAFHQIGVGFER